MPSHAYASYLSTMLHGGQVPGQDELAEQVLKINLVALLQTTMILDQESSRELFLADS